MRVGAAGTTAGGMKAGAFWCIEAFWCIDRCILIMCSQLELCMDIITLSSKFVTGRIGAC